MSKACPMSFCVTEVRLLPLRAACADWHTGAFINAAWSHLIKGESGGEPAAVPQRWRTPATPLAFNLILSHFAQQHRHQFSSEVRAGKVRSGTEGCLQ